VGAIPPGYSAAGETRLVRAMKVRAVPTPLSPVLANGYLHYALDLGFEEVVKPLLAGEALLCRFADDGVCAFRYQEDAERFYRVLPKRWEKFKLEVAPEKTRILRFSRFHPSRKRQFTSLGFEFYWNKDRQGAPRVQRRTARKRLQAACHRIKEWIRTHRHLPGWEFFQRLNSRLQGHYNYYGVRGNARSLYRSTKGPSPVRSRGSTVEVSDGVILGRSLSASWTSST
jgi:RNA-directed DNA polymerase